MTFPKKAYVDISLSINLDEWLTEDDKQSIIENYKDDESIDIYLKQLISDYIDNQIKYDNIFIDLI